MGLHGFTFGLEDVMPTPQILAAKQDIMDDAHTVCEDLIQQYKAGKIERVPGCDPELSLEQLMGKELDAVSGTHRC